MVKNEMIERGALAIKSIDDRNNARDHSSTYSTPESIAEDCRAKVRAVLEVMLEPTDEMLEAAVSEFTFHATRPWPGTTPQSIQKDVFRRAIKAALDPEEA